MNRNERRRKVKECEAELSYIRKHTEYRDLKLGHDFMLPEKELDLLKEGLHEDKELQGKFNYAVDLFARVDALNNLVFRLKHPPTSTEVRPVGRATNNLNPQSALS